MRALMSLEAEKTTLALLRNSAGDPVGLSMSEDDDVRDLVHVVVAVPALKVNPVSVVTVASGGVAKCAVCNFRTVSSHALNSKFSVIREFDILTSPRHCGTTP